MPSKAKVYKAKSNIIIPAGTELKKFPADMIKRWLELGMIEEVKATSTGDK